MLTFHARKGLNMFMTFTLLIGAAGSHFASSVQGGKAGSLKATALQQTGYEIRLTYDANNNILSRTDANGAITYYEYDAENNLIAIIYPDKSEVHFVYDKLGRRVAMTDTFGLTSYDYDSHSRLVKVTDSKGNTLQYAYDTVGQVVKIVYPDGSTVNYTWDENGHLVKVQDALGTTIYHYDQSGRLASRNMPNGVSTHYEYDKANRLTSVQHAGPGGDLLLGFKSEFDAEGNRIQLTQMGQGNDLITRFQYDNLNRLTNLTNPDGEIINYNYDSIGNRISMVSSKFGETMYAYNGWGQISGIMGPQEQFSFQYDTNGNLAEMENLQSQLTTSYAWDAENRLISLTNDTTNMKFNYGGDGGLASIENGGKLTSYLSDPLAPSPTILAGYQDIGKIESSYLFGNTLIGEQDLANGNRYFLEDGLGSIRAAVDASGQMLEGGSFSLLSKPAGNLAQSPLAMPGVPSALFPQNFMNEYNAISNDTMNAVVDEARSQLIEKFFGEFNAAFALQNYGPLFEASYRESGETLGRNFATGLSSFISSANFLGKMVQVDADLRAQGFKVGSQEYTLGYTEQWGRNGIDLVFNTLAGAASYSLHLDPATSVALSVGASSLARGISDTVAGAATWYGDRSVRPYTWLDARKWMPSDEYYNYMENRWSRPVGTTDTTFERLPDINNNTLDGSLLNRYMISACPPPLCDNDGGGSGAAVGGVSLDQAAKVLVNINDITGASYDPKTSQVTLIGTQDLSLPPMNMDVLVVAIRSIYSGTENPGVTMVPVDPTMQDKTQRVEYFGQTQNTHFGQVMFEADRYLKSLASGRDTLTNQPVEPNVPGYKSELTLMTELNSGDVPWHRNWFVPGELVLKKSQDGRSITFDKATIKLESRFIKFLPDGSQQDVPGSSPVTDAFTKFVTENYDAFATGKPELRELVQLAKIVGFVRWLHDNSIPVDLSWVNNYQVKNVQTPLTTPGIKVENPDGSYIMGGVDFPPDTTYTSDSSGATERLVKQAETSRPADLPVSWDFQENGQDLTAVAFNVTPTSLTGGYISNVSDISLPLGGGCSVSFTRQFNSLNPTEGLFGPGWVVHVPSLSFQGIQAILRKGTDQVKLSQFTDGFFHPEDKAATFGSLGLTGGDPFDPLRVPEGFQFSPTLSGQPLELMNAEGKSTSFTGLTLLETDGSGMAFDASGRLIAQRDTFGRVLDYTYAGSRLSVIADDSGHSLQFNYGSSGLVSELMASNGQVIHYSYNSTGQLTGVTNEAGLQKQGYAYDEQGRLNKVTNASGRSVQISYDGLGRMLSVQSTRGTSTIRYDDAANQVIYLDASGNSVIGKYDEQKRLISETDPLGQVVKYQYDPDGALAGYTDRNGNTTSYQYDDNGFLSTITSPLGEQTRLLGYNEMGMPQASIDPGSGITFYEYDDHGRLTGIERGLQFESISGGVIQSKPVDPQITTFTYDSSGNLASVQDPAGFITHYSYDDMGNLTSVLLPGGGEIRQTFDERSNLTSIADAAGNHVDYGYDQVGQLATITTPAGVAKYEYANGLVTSVTDARNHTLQYGYDEGGRLKSVTEPGRGDVIYEYNVNGNLLEIKDVLGRRTQFQYDAAGRVVGIYYIPTNEQGAPGTTSTQPVSKGSTPISTPWFLIGVGGGAVLIAAVIILVVWQTKRKRYQTDSSQDGMSTSDDDDPFKL